MRRLLSSGNTSPLHHVCQLFSVALCWAHATPDVWPADASLFAFRLCRPLCAAPHTHRDQGPRRLAVEPDIRPWHCACPRKPSVPCRVHWGPAYRSRGCLVGPVSVWLTTEASPHPTMRWPAPYEGVRLGLSRSLHGSHVVARHIWLRRGVSPRRCTVHRLPRGETHRCLLMPLDTTIDLRHTARNCAKCLA